MRTLINYKHYPIERADEDYCNGIEKLYRAVTINWTYASDKKGKQETDKVHRNEYVFTLKQLIDFIRDTVEVAEDIVSIEKISQKQKE